MFFGYSSYTKSELHDRKSYQYDQLSKLKDRINRAYNELNCWRTQINVYYDKYTPGKRKAGFWDHWNYGYYKQDYDDLVRFKRKRDRWKDEVNRLKAQRTKIYNDINSIKAEIQRRKRN